MSSLQSISTPLIQNSAPLGAETQAQIITVAPDVPRVDETKMNVPGLLVVDRSAMEPRQIADGVFVGKAKAASGEVFNLCMELVTAENQKQWEQYRKSASKVAEKDLEQICSLALFPDWSHNIDSIKEKTGYTEAEIHDLVDQLQKRGFTTKHREVLLQNTYGSAVMYTSVGSYIIYAAKTQDFRIDQVPLLSSHQEIKAKDFGHFYQDIIMSVGSSFDEEASYRNMGIFRNPYNVMDGTYKSIALTLHGFSAAVVQKYFPEKQEMTVSPISSMQALICNALKPEDYWIEGCKEEEKEKLKEIANRQFTRATYGAYSTNHIKLGALADLYYANAITLS